MKNYFYNLTKTRKLENAILFVIIIFFYKIIFPVADQITTRIINEILFVSSFYLWSVYFSDFIQSKPIKPLSVILNAGVLNASIFFLISIFSLLFPDDFNFAKDYDLFTVIFNTIIGLFFISSLAYIFAVFRELFILKQRRNPSVYFSIMVFFILAYSFSGNLPKDMEYVQETFFVVSILLISINSIRISWIAFLTKKQKLFLLMISVILAILFGLNFGNVAGKTVLSDTLTNLAPSLHGLLEIIMIYGIIHFGIIFFTTLFHIPTAEAFDRKAEEVSSLMDLSKLITQVFDFKELSETVTEITVKVCNSDCAWFVSTTGKDYSITSVKNIGYVEADRLTKFFFKDSHDENVRTFNIIEEETKTNEKDLFNNFQSFAIAPLRVYNYNKGFLFAARKDAYKFDEEDKKAITAFAEYAAIAIENAKLLEESLEKERLEKELEVARDIQYRILPKTTPNIDELEISAFFIPAFEVGGDYYDFFTIDEDKLGFVIADVSGKGISAAFVMAEVKGIFESLSKLILSPKQLLIKANEILKGSLDKKNFVTAVYGVVYLNDRKVVLSRAGHTPIYHRSTNKLHTLIPPGIGLGIDQGDTFSNVIEEIEIKVKEDDILVLFTDGITEAKNFENNDFGTKRFENIILNFDKLEVSKKTLEALSKEILNQISVFSKDNQQHDDITLISFKWKK